MKRKNRLSLSKLVDKGLVRFEEGKRFLAYFCQTVPVSVDRRLISELKGIAAKAGGRSVRLCLHRDPGEPLHNMIIVQKKGRYLRPHKHLSKPETFHIIEGKMAVFSFDEAGRVIDAGILGGGGAAIYAMGLGMFHTSVTLTPTVVYHESRPGPFAGPGDSIYPDWAPDESDFTAAEEYTCRLLKHAGF